MRWWWVRHGPTHAKTMIGWTDLPADLSDVAALKRLSDYLPDAPVVSSDLSRAVTTADAIQNHRHRLPHTPELREINFGKWENRTFKDVETASPDLIRAYWEQPGTPTPPDGESWNSIETRVNRFVDAYPTHSGDIIAVAHMGVILTQVRRACGLTAYEAFSRKIDNLSVTCLEITDGQWRVHCINHLA
ncbi:MAG: histidine phosphatase family protein [Litoreibacter sp.]